MEVVGTLYKLVKAVPVPGFFPSFSLQFNILIREMHDEVIPERGGFLINAGWKYPPDNKHQQEPQDGEDKERRWLNVF